MSLPTNVLYYGKEAPLPDQLPLRAGPLTMLEVGRTAPGIKSKIYTKSK